MTGGRASGGEVTVAVRRGGAGGEPALPARRLVLTPAEWAVLVDGRSVHPPPGFEVRRTGAAERDDAVTALVRRGVLTAADGAPARPVPSLAAELAVMARPLLTIRLDVTGRGGSRAGWFAVASGLVAGVLTLPGGGIELSLARDVRLGAELARAVPAATAVTGPGWPEEPVAGAGALSGRVPLVLLEDVEPPAVPEPGPDEAALATELSRRTGGSLTALVLGRPGTSVGAGQVTWLATDGGWIGVRPIADGSPRRLVDVVPVQPADLGSWVAPAVAALSENLDERT